ncbi:LPXTG-motif cell wall-anchored protein [Streptomyces canus]|uniref:LPXTG cell wall anchor domain-containing protein n=1 Tax=Streptomyces canus TaxID=58343 RepID=UPI002788AD81|nr:LPXTG cell wall anchor domain-containing protein [Streptomyces canus]MDQ0601734.1 LPXTG-motif cell wall-anchored protein [Streptomyces canus]
MSSRRMTTIAGSLVTASFSAVLIFSTAAGADEGPGSSKGGKAVDEAPAGVKLTTLLPEQISVDNSSEKTDLTATVKNEGTKDSGKIRLLVVGFDGLTVNSVQGCSSIAESDLPEGSNSGFACPIDNLAAGKSKSYAVDATFDLGKTGKICLPVQTGDGKKTFWQQGPVPFGTTNPSPNAPATPLLLGTDNQPVGPGGDKELPQTGPARDLLPLGAGGAALLTAGAAGMWWSTRRREA